MNQSNDVKFIELARRLDPGNDSLAKELKDVFKEFVQEDVQPKAGYETGLGYYVIESEPTPVEDVAWFTLIEGLTERGKLVDIDFRESPEGVAANINDLLSNQPSDPNRWKWVNLKERWKDFPHVFLKEVQLHVIGPEKILAILHGNYSEENYEVCLLNASDYAPIEELFRKMSYGKIEKVVDMTNPGGIY